MTGVRRGIGGGRTFKVGERRSRMEVRRPCPQWAPEKKPLWRSGGEAQKITTLFAKMCHFVTASRTIFAFVAYKCSISNGRKINLEAEKW